MPAPAVEQSTPVVHTVAAIKPPRVEHSRAIHVPGRTAANMRSALAARASGVIAELPFDEGERVEKGEIVMRLDAEEKAAAVETARQILAQREAELKAAERLAKSGNLASLQLDSTRSAFAEAMGQLEAAQAELERTIVRAPFDGVIDRLSVELGSSVMQGGEIATVLNLDPVLAVGQVSEHDLRYVSPGQKGEVRLVDGRELTGTIRYISLDAAEQTRTFRFELALDSAKEIVPAGMTAEITLRAEPVPAVLVPRSVITLGEEGELGIHAVNGDDTVTFHPIDLVEDTPEGLYLAGVPQDARVIVAGQDLVSAGDTVNPVMPDADLLGALASDSRQTQ